MSRFKPALVGVPMKYTSRHQKWLDVYEPEFSGNRKRGLSLEEADKFAREAANYRVTDLDEVLREYNE